MLRFPSLLLFLREKRRHLINQKEKEKQKPGKHCHFRIKATAVKYFDAK